MNKCTQCYSYAINPTSHGRDGTDTDLCDVCYWRKRAEGVTATQLRVLRIAYGALGDCLPCYDPECKASQVVSVQVAFDAIRAAFPKDFK